MDRPAEVRRGASRARLDDLGDRWFATKHRANPFLATLAGLTEFDDRCPDPSTEASAAASAAFARMGEELAGLPVEPDRSTDHGVLEFLVRASSGDATHALWAAGVSTEGFVSPQGALFQAMPAVALGDPTAVDRYRRRLDGVAEFLDRLGERVRAEAARGRPSTRLGLRAARDQLEAHLAKGDDRNALLAPTRTGAWPDATDLARTTLRRQVRPAMARLAATYEDLLPGSRDDAHVGVCWIDGGDEAYADAVHRHTTLERSPAELHRLGHELLQELRGRFAGLSATTLGTDDMATAAHRLLHDPAGRFADRGALLAATTSALRRADAAVPTVVGAARPLPECRIEQIRPEDSPAASLAYYRPPAADSSRPGALCLRTADAPSTPRFDIEAVTFHESVPGHHLQLATAADADIPTWRRHIDTELGAYTEGWGLYAEQLADELDLYSDELQRLGMIALAMRRAARLVVDTGLHAFGWSTTQAERFLRDNTVMSEHDIGSEVRRFIAWPGQALSYATGHQAILRARDGARAADGTGRTDAAFHTRVLGRGPVPLALL